MTMEVFVLFLKYHFNTTQQIYVLNDMHRMYHYHSAWVVPLIKYLPLPQVIIPESRD